MSKKNYSVIVPKEVYPKPSVRELTAAYILIDFFDSDIRFVVRGKDKTPDFLIKGKYWELKPLQVTVNITYNTHSVMPLNNRKILLLTLDSLRCISIK